MKLHTLGMKLYATRGTAEAIRTMGIEVTQVQKAQKSTDIIDLMESGKTSVSWNFTTFPSQTFKDDFGAALLEYANGNMSFDKVEKQVVDEWASEKGAN